MMIMFFFRRDFERNLVFRYNNLRSLVPAVVSRQITVTNKTLEEEETLKARIRPTVCLCSDWRNYQSIAMGHDAAVITNLFETYYDVVFVELRETVPQGTYYPEWVADELFVIFYDADDNLETAAISALIFAKNFATRISKKIRDTTGFPFIYDIGMEAGTGMLGLQGPKERRKTTITGEVAGTAKRLETEAKNLCYAQQTLSNFPIIAMDEYLLKLAPQIFETSPEFRTAGGKNIEGRNFGSWSAESFGKLISNQQT